MAKDKNRVFPVEKAEGLDTFLRRLFQNPRRILKPYVEVGMTALDLGCGVGYFTLPMAEAVGASGKVVAVDLQEGMLRLVEKRVKGTDLEGRVLLHHCGKSNLGYGQLVDFVLAFYVMHEIPDQPAVLSEIASILRPGGRMLVVEPPFHVSNADFEKMTGAARKVGLEPSRGPRMFLNKTVVLTRT